ncbi:MAG: DUF1080 domain-containing protein [Bryobacteraceae bacterium]|nr:DUF1080 domain-containing protein [Solibacteraceae bacterium]MCO5350441.1 DUF1080 domain-containing protein [Bryobacteraceae bacterium]
MRFAILSLLALPLFAQGIPGGFTPIFNGRDTTGWHISEVNHHGDTRAWSVKDGVLMVTQDKPGNGGILLTDKQYRNFEVSIEINPDFGCDGGLFLRSNEKGQGYQVMIDYLEGGSVGGIYGEGLKGVKPDNEKARQWQTFWKKGEWNHIRARITGDVPLIQVWLNGEQIVNWQSPENHLIDGVTSGMIAVQAHRSDPTNPKSRWTPGGFHRFRNIAVKELEP